MKPEEHLYVLLSGHSDSFSKYDKKLFLHKLPTITFKEVILKKVTEEFESLHFA